MFPVDSLHPSYYEDRSAEKTKKPATQQTQPKPQLVRSSSCEPPSSRFLQRPPLTRPGSSGMLGTLFNGFSRPASPARSDKSTSSSGTTTPVTAPLMPTKAVSRAEVEAMMAAELKKDADIQAFRAW